MWTRDGHAVHSRKDFHWLTIPYSVLSSRLKSALSSSKDVIGLQLSAFSTILNIAAAPR